MLLCFPVLWDLLAAPEQLWQEPGASLARGGSPREQREPGPCPVLEVCKAPPPALTPCLFIALL